MKRRLITRYVVTKPSVCPTCDGERVIPSFAGWRICESCCCGICGKPTDTAPECGDCFVREDAMQVRREDRP